MSIHPAARIHIGTSGWHYPHWKKKFYPEALPESEWLVHYADHFQTVEINNSFYRLPEAHTLQEWYNAVPPDFLFAIKAGRYITHMKKLHDPEASTQALFERIRVLGKKLGPMLFQLPPRWQRNPDRLERFLQALPSGMQYAFEFRDPSWFHESIAGLLRHCNAAFCIYDLNGRQSPCTLTADFVYVRLHGPGDAYQGCYGKEGLSKWHDKISGWAKDGLEVHCFFDNDDSGYAIQDAQILQSM